VRHAPALIDQMRVTQLIASVLSVYTARDRIRERPNISPKQEAARANIVSCCTHKFVPGSTLESTTGGVSRDIGYSGITNSIAVNRLASNPACSAVSSMSGGRTLVHSGSFL